MELYLPAAVASGETINQSTDNDRLHDDILSLSKLGQYLLLLMSCHMNL